MLAYKIGFKNCEYKYAFAGDCLLVIEYESTAINNLFETVDLKY